MSLRFRWIIKNRLAGMELPGKEHPEVEDFMFLKKQGIGTIVSLTETVPAYTSFLRHKFEWLHFPIDDFKAPDIEAAAMLVADIDARLESGRPVLVHCLFGIGRTGTMLAAYIIYKYREPASGVIPWIRRIHPEYIQSEQQEQFLGDFSAVILSRPAPKSPEGW